MYCVVCDCEHAPERYLGLGYCLGPVEWSERPEPVKPGESFQIIIHNEYKEKIDIKVEFDDKGDCHVFVKERVLQ